MKIRTSSGSHETQREWVYHKIRFALMAGRYQPGEKAVLRVQARDWRNRPLRTELSVSVTDASLS